MVIILPTLHGNTSSLNPYLKIQKVRVYSSRELINHHFEKVEN